MSRKRLSANAAWNKKVDFRVAWLRDFEERVLAQDSKRAGKIDWNTATHLYNIGKTPQEAADQYVENRK